MLDGGVACVSIPTGIASLSISASADREAEGVRDNTDLIREEAAVGSPCTRACKYSTRKGSFRNTLLQLPHPKQIHTDKRAHPGKPQAHSEGSPAESPRGCSVGKE